jgi:hypothetical protein
MKIDVPVAAFHEYNTAVYVVRAFQALGHDCRVITQAEYYEDRSATDLFFGVDSAGSLDFPEKHCGKTMMWFIDSRHNCDSARRQPGDDNNARKIMKGGGWVFQAQKRDWARCVRLGLMQSSWLPLAADTEVWRPYLDEKMTFDVAFGGNVWDGTRRAILDDIAKTYSLLEVRGTPEELARAYSRARIGFNVSSFYGTDVDYDTNMRVFEVLSCGRPLLTNYQPEMDELGMQTHYNCVTFRDRDEVMSILDVLLKWDDVELVELGVLGRELVFGGHTYVHRMKEALDIWAAWTSPAY